MACLCRLVVLLALMAFAGEVPICASGLLPCIGIGLSLRRFDLLTHHFAFFELSSKKVVWNSVVQFLIAGFMRVCFQWASTAGVKRLALCQDSPCSWCQLVGQRSNPWSMRGQRQHAGR